MSDRPSPPSAPGYRVVSAWVPEDVDMGERPAVARRREPPPDWERRVREIVREETRRERTVLAAIRRAILQVASALREDTTGS